MYIHIINKIKSWAVNKIHTIYLKELNDINELFEENSRLPSWLKKVCLFLKKVFCILTIKEKSICVLPYKQIKSKLIVNVITKIMTKNTKSVVLSNYLNKLEYMKKTFIKNNIYIYNGKILGNYLIYNFVEYISKLKDENTHIQEISILVNNCDTLNKNNIIYLANNLKRVNIVTNKLNDFAKIATYLENEKGIGITVTSNKRKSLAKSKIIINIDFSEETINQFNINRKSIIININNNVQVKSKLFNGINVYDYNIEYKKNLDDELYKSFEEKLVYESKTDGKSYNEIIEQISKDNVKIVNLIGKNGPIDIKEYKRN